MSRRATSLPCLVLALLATLLVALGIPGLVGAPARTQDREAIHRWHTRLGLLPPDAVGRLRSVVDALGTDTELVELGENTGIAAECARHRRDVDADLLRDLP